MAFVNATSSGQFVSYGQTGPDAATIQKKLISDPRSLLWDDEARGFSASECHCCGELSREPGYDNYRNIAENLIVSAVGQFFPEKDPIHICSIGTAGCFQEFVIHALLAKIKKTVHWTLVGGATESFTTFVKTVSPNSTVEDVYGLFENMTESQKQAKVDVFCSIDGMCGDKAEGYLTERMERLANRAFSVLVDETRKDRNERIKAYYCEGHKSAIKLSYKSLSDTDTGLRKSYTFTPIVQKTDAQMGMIFIKSLF